MLPRSSATMGIHEQELDEERSQWVAARLPNPAPTNGRDVGNEGEYYIQFSIACFRSHQASAKHRIDMRTPPRRQPAEVTNHDRSTNTSPHLNVQAPPFQPSGIPNNSHPIADPKVTTSYSSNDVRSDPTYWSSLSNKQNYENTVAYTSPWTGAEMTRKELMEYGVGKQILSSDGGIVLTYFKPSFVEENIWARWEAKKETGNEG